MLFVALATEGKGNCLCALEACGAWDVFGSSAIESAAVKQCWSRRTVPAMGDLGNCCALKWIASFSLETDLCIKVLQ